MFEIGRSKQIELLRSVEILQEISSLSKDAMMFILYFLADSGYENTDILQLAHILKSQIEGKKDD